MVHEGLVVSFFQLFWRATFFDLICFVIVDSRALYYLEFEEFFYWTFITNVEDVAYQGSWEGVVGHHMWDATSSSIHRRQKKMETFAFLKGLAQMRLFHCVWISSLVILGLLLTSTNLSNKDVSKTLNARNVGKNLNDAVRAAGVIADGQFDGDTWSSNTSVGSLKVSYRAWDSSGGCKAYRKKHPLEIRRFDTQLSLSNFMRFYLPFDSLFVNI